MNHKFWDQGLLKAERVIELWNKFSETKIMEGSLCEC